jgi:hypothetical protein
MNKLPKIRTLKNDGIYFMHKAIPSQKLGLWVRIVKTEMVRQNWAAR